MPSDGLVVVVVNYDFIVVGFLAISAGVGEGGGR